MSHRSESVGESPSERSAGSSVPAWVDYLVGGVVGLVGLLLLGVGALLTTILNRSVITNLVREGIVEAPLTEAELNDLAVPTTYWSGIGLVLVGLVVLAVAVAYVYYQRQSQRRSGARGRVSNFWPNAVAGAVAALVFSFVPFAQAVGGAIAGYLEHDGSGDSTRAGAASGAIGAAPALLVAPFVLAGIAIGADAIGDGGLTVFAGGIVVAGVLFGAVVGTILGAIGGYAGGYVASDRY